MKPGTSLILFCLSVCVHAQVTTGQISGLVTDPSGVPIPAVEVQVFSADTSLKRAATSNAQGFYLAGSLPAGSYRVRVEKAGFKSFEQSNIVLTSGERVNVSAKLQIGSVSEVVNVVARGEQVETESGAVERLIDGDQARDLALNGRNLIQLLMLVPGVTVGTDQFDRGSIAFGGVGDFYVNGTRSTSNGVMVDGGSNQDSGNIVSQTNNVSVDFVKEVKVASSGYSAEYGRYGGGQINFQTRGGGEKYHGSVYEFFRNDKLNTRSFFAPKIEKLRLNNFGWSIGGPLLLGRISTSAHKTLFFFGGQEYKRRIDGDTRRAQIPTHAERDGILTSTATLRYPTNFPVVALRGQLIEDPTRATPENSTGRNILPRQYMTANGIAMMKIFDAVEKVSALYIDRNVANNITFQLANSDIRRQDLLKLDYQPSSANQFSFRYIYDTGSNAVPYETGTLPTFSATRRNRAQSIQIAWTRVLSKSMINEFAIQSNYLFLERIPYGDMRFPSTYGLKPNELHGNETAIYGLPTIRISGYTLISGARANPHSPVWDFTMRDSFSYLRGKHNLKAGFLYIHDRKNERTNSALTGDVTFQNTGNLYTTNNSLFDALIGNYRQYVESDVDKFNKNRFTQFEAYAADTWKVRRNLTVDIGARVYFMQPPYLTDNTMSTFLPGLYSQAYAQQVIASGTGVGELRPGVGVPLNGMVTAGTGNLPKGFYHLQNKISPRFGFAFDPKGNGDFAIRGGGAVYYDRLPAGDIATAGGNPPFVNTVTLFDGRYDDPTAGRAGLFPLSVTSFRPDVVSPATYNYNFGIQKKLPFQSLLDLNYVATMGRHLMRRPDINQVSPSIQNDNRTLNINALRPYSGYTSINLWESSAASTYHGLQAGLTRRYSKSVTYSVAYTWSKVLTDASTKDTNVENPLNYRAEKSHATFDRNHVFVASYVYKLPFFRNQRGLMGRVAGGWELSGITQLQSGQWLSPSYSTATGTRRPDRVGEVVYFDPRETQTLTGGNNQKLTGNFYFDPTPGRTFVDPGAARYGNSSPNIVRGPGRHNWDLSVFKVFKVHERANLQFRAEAFNVWNHASFRNPNMGANSLNYATISDAGPPRLVQLGLKLLF
jgi:hypothetical protein